MHSFPAEIQHIVSGCNFGAFGITEARFYSEEYEKYGRWLNARYHADMKYLERHREAKFNPQKLLKDCQSILLVGLPYLSHPLKSHLSESIGQGRIARYAWGQDYHTVMRNKLRQIVECLRRIYPKDRFIWSVDATPLSEKCYAQKAGMGFIGENTLLIHPIYGSWFFIGEILSTKSFPVFIESRPLLLECGHCRLCLDACPTGALRAPYELDCSRCISYLTIENKGPIPLELRQKIGNRLFGCDLCQEVCPHNQDTPITQESAFLKHQAGPTQELAKVLSIEDELHFQREYAGTPLLRSNRIGLIRNACVVAANNRVLELIPCLTKLASDPHPIIQEHARWALRHLSRGKS